MKLEGVPRCTFASYALLRDLLSSTVLLLPRCVVCGTRCAFVNLKGWVSPCMMVELYTLQSAIISRKHGRWRCWKFGQVFELKVFREAGATACKSCLTMAANRPYVNELPSPLADSTIRCRTSGADSYAQLEATCNDNGSSTGIPQGEVPPRCTSILLFMMQGSVLSKMTRRVQYRCGAAS